MVITAVTNEMVPQVREFLSSRKEFGFREDWDGIFEYRWKQENFPYGYAIVHEGSVLGFLGTMFCERTIRGKPLVYCTLCAWIVDDGHKGARSLAVALLAPALKMKNVMIACFTANETAQKSYEKIGFKRIDDHQVALSTFTSYWRRKAKRHQEVTCDLNAIEPHLDERDARILRDHKHLPCKHLLVRNKTTNQYCYVIGTTTPFRLRKLAFASRILNRLFAGANCFNICYVSDSRLFAESFAAIAAHLRKNCNSLALRYDARLIPGRLSILEYKMPSVRLCFSPTEFQPTDVDNLYSELVTENLY